jgi:hypothetical protein
MLRKLTIVLAAAASLSVAALAPSTASAKPFGGWGGFHHRHFGGFGIGVGYVDDGCYVTRRVPTPYGYRFRTVNVCSY